MLFGVDLPDQEEGEVAGSGGIVGSGGIGGSGGSAGIGVAGVDPMGGGAAGRATGGGSGQAGGDGKGGDYCEREGEGCDTNLLGNCSLGTLRCSDGEFLVCQPNQLATDEICGDDVDNDCNGDVDEGCPCGHDKCDEGAQLNAACTVNGVPDTCVAIICASDPSCCEPITSPSGAWNVNCVAKVYSVCGSLICPAHQGVCAHSVCETGTLLTQLCDGNIGCVKKVCDSDPYCCGLNEAPDPMWDAFCVQSAVSLCSVRADVPVCPP
jgi:hypothetical protein